MAREYAKAYTAFWTGEFGASIKGHYLLQSLAWYLITSPHSNRLGLYRLPLSYIVEDLGIEDDASTTRPKRVAKAFERITDAMETLCQRGFCAYDWDAQVVFVVEMARHEEGEEPIPLDRRTKAGGLIISNQVKGLAKILPSLLKEPRKASVYNDFMRRYSAGWSLLFEYVENEYGTRIERVVDASEARSTSSPNSDPDPDPDPDPLPEPDSAEPAQTPGPASGGRKKQRSAAQVYEDPEFGSFWDAYPKKASKGEAAKAWAQTDPDLANGEYVKRPANPAEIMTALAERSKSHDWIKDGGRYIPNASTWLRSAGWADQVPRGFGAPKGPQQIQASSRAEDYAGQNPHGNVNDPRIQAKLEAGERLMAERMRQ